MLDHNEKSQTIDGIEQAEILEIIDHHRLGDIQTGYPVYVRNELVGSTSTLISNMYFESGIKPAKQIGISHSHSSSRKHSLVMRVNMYRLKIRFAVSKK